MSAAAFAARRKRQPMAQAEAARQLRRCTLGVQMAEVVPVVGQRMDQWVDAQLGLAVTAHQMRDAVTSRRLPGFASAPELSQYGAAAAQYWTWKFYQPEKLRVRLVYALTEYFSMGGSTTTHDAYSLYTDFLETQCVNGTFRSLIEGITRSQLMARWLTYMHNEKTNGVRQPDENYAREIMQLYTIGLWELRQNGTRKPAGELEVTDPRYVASSTADVPTYTQADITNVARVFTGMTPTYSWDGGATFETPDNSWFPGTLPGASQWRDPLGNVGWAVPLVFAPSRHESSLPKQALQGRINIAVGVGGEASLSATLDALVAHPSTAPYFAGRMIRLLITSNPSPEYVARVAAVFLNDGAGVVGNLRAVFRAILLDQEALAPVGKALTTRVPSFEEQRLSIAYAHAPKPTVDGAPLGEGIGAYPGSADLVGALLGMPADTPYGYGQNPSVFGRWPAAYRAAGAIFAAGILSPELKTLAEVECSDLLNSQVLLERIGNLAPAADLADAMTTGNNAALVSRLSDLLTGGTAPPSYLADLVSAFATLPSNTADDLAAKYRATAAALWLSPWGIARH